MSSELFRGRYFPVQTRCPAPRQCCEIGCCWVFAFRWHTSVVFCWPISRAVRLRAVMQMHVFAVIASEPKTDIFGRCPQLYFPVFENEELKCREPVIVSVLRGERQKRMRTRRCDSCCDFLFAAIFYCRRHRLGFAIWRIRRRGGVFG